MAFERTTSIAGGTLRVSSAATGSWTSSFTFPNGLKLSQFGSSPFQVDSFPYSAGYEYNDAGTLTGITFDGRLYTDATMIKSIQDFIKGQQIPSGPISTQVIASANSIENERQKQITAPNPPTATATPTTTTPAVKPVTGPAPTTSPSNALPLGDDIDDIYDPNLTPEQIASLSPGDQRARENFFIEEAGGTPNTDGLSGVEADGTIVVTAPAPEEEIITIAAQQDQIAFQARNDWRVRLALTDDPNANYLYKSDDPGILAPLAATNGVIFPYTPQISVNYAASYSPTELVHSNYKVFQYSSSSVDQVSITCEFTAQDTNEADYMLAVIHFFRSMTKMFYGKDSNPRRGTPPPLCYMFGMGNYQFAAHPLAITGFSYTLPTDVDYIKTMSTPTNSLESLIGSVKSLVSTTKRLLGTGAEPGGNYPPANLNQIGYSGEEGTVTWVPTKIQLAITCLPMMSRNQVSNNFSLKDYASGKLLNGINKPGGGMW
jgi:hypothetical protein